MAEAKMAVRADLSLNGAVVRPGDTLIVCLPRDTSMDGGERVKKALAEMMPGVHVVVVSGVEHLAAYRPGGGDDG